MKIFSPAFEDGKSIPDEYTCTGADTSPELNFEDVPAEAKSLVLITDDPDAPMGTWDHWIVFNIPATTKKIEKGLEPEGVAGNNSWKRTGYGGPCPPSGTHRYFFKLYALDTMLELSEGVTKAEVMTAMDNHIIAEAQLMGTYSKG
jgi:Raf kinase inhibitor-like YbhB/YbcL family protein